jgi:hypothetical protein
MEKIWGQSISKKLLSMAEFVMIIVVALILSLRFLSSRWLLIFYFLAAQNNF